MPPFSIHEFENGGSDEDVDRVQAAVVENAFLELLQGGRAEGVLAPAAPSSDSSPGAHSPPFSPSPKDLLAPNLRRLPPYLRRRQVNTLVQVGIYGAAY